MCGGGSAPKAKAVAKPVETIEPKTVQAQSATNAGQVAGDTTGGEQKKAALLNSKKTGALGLSSLPFYAGKNLFGA